MILTLKTLREECGGCPTSYSGETTDGRQIDMYLRNGHMSIKLDDQSIISTRTPGLDGVCSLEDFKRYAARHGYDIMTEDAETSSSIHDLEDTIQELYKDTVRMTFIQEFHSDSINRTFKKGESVPVNLKGAAIMLGTGLVVIEHEHDQAKLDAFIANQQTTY